MFKSLFAWRDNVVIHLSHTKFDKLRGILAVGGCTPEFLCLSKRSVRHTHALTSSARYLLLMGDLNADPIDLIEKCQPRNGPWGHYLQH
jgi:hypothetical protein